ncbi:MAG: hypothetical protein ACRDKZ_04520 [Actinomycetota bacterium]
MTQEERPVIETSRLEAFSDGVHGLAAADLFALADAIAGLIDAPVTMEDRLSRVVAYSGRQDEADDAPAETIIGRRVPDRFLEKLEAEGVFRRFRNENGGVYIEGIGEGILPRLAVPVRAGRACMKSRGQSGRPRKR